MLARDCFVSVLSRKKSFFFFSHTSCFFFSFFFFLKQINFVLGKPPAAGAGKMGAALPQLPVAQKQTNQIISFAVPSTAPAPAGASAAAAAKAKAPRSVPVKHELETDDASTGVGKRRRDQVDYKTLEEGVRLPVARKMVPAAAPGAASAAVAPPGAAIPSSQYGTAPVAAPSQGPVMPPSASALKNKPKKTSSAVSGAPALPLTGSSSSAVSKPKSSSSSSGQKKAPPPRLSPMPAQFFTTGPPFVSMDFKYPEDLMPKRPFVAPFDPNTQDPALEEKKRLLASVEKDLADLATLESLRMREKDNIGKHFKAKAVKARKMQLDMMKRNNPVFQEAAARVASSGGASNKRPLGKSRNDMDYEDEYDEDDMMVMPSDKRKAVRSSSLAATSAPKKPKAPVKRPIPQSLPVWLQKSIKLIDDLLNQPASVFFRVPVNPVVDNLPDYLEVIQNPMDLGTMRTKCENSVYTSVDDVLLDLNLIMKNCITYNGVDSPVTADCKSLAKIWSSRISKIRGGEDGAASDKRGRGARNANRPSSKAATAPKAPVLKDLTWPEKELLMGYIGALPPEQLSNVVQIVGEVRALEGGDQEGGEVELDFGELPTITLRKLQDFVFAYRRENGLEVTILEAPAPTAAATSAALASAVGDDDVHLADDEDHNPTFMAPAAPESFVAPSPKPKKTRAPKVAKKEESAPAPRGRAQVPKTQEDLKLLAEKTKENTESALQELKNELKRMAGKVVDTDHVQMNSSGLVQAANEYSLDPAVLVQHLGENSDDSVSSDTVSSDDEDEVQKVVATRTDPGSVHIIAVADQGADVVIENTDGWRQLEEGKSGGLEPSVSGGGGAAPEAGADAGLWEAFANKDAQQMELAKARKEHEEKLKRERELKEEELRKLEKEKRLKQEEEDRRKREEKEREEKEAQRLREEERLARKREREEDEPRVDLTEQQRLMADFERN